MTLLGIRPVADNLHRCVMVEDCTQIKKNSPLLTLNNSKDTRKLCLSRPPMTVQYMQQRLALLKYMLRVLETDRSLL